ncbi:MAG: crotonase/enoyl-CoA hydratase family protein [Actinomycetota bacterium]|nr:crotonase/enoyl-CoA hydratase family protein [Actinomycetota bacterium]
MSDYETIRLAVDAGVATLTLNRPERLNAFTTEMGEEIIAAFDHIDADDDIRAVVVTGAGRAFCAGADLGAGGDTFNAIGRARSQKGDRAPRDTGGLVTLRIFECLKPVIAAINGPAVGIGASMTLPMDVRFIAEGAKMGFVFAARGIVPDGAASWFLPRAVGISQALEWCLTARVFPAEEALGGGLVRAVVPGDDLLGAARALATEMAANVGPVSAAITRQLLWRMQAAEHPMVAHRVDSQAIAETGAMADAAEGVLAFLEKRPASWTLKVSNDLPGVFPWWEEPRY